MRYRSIFHKVILLWLVIQGGLAQAGDRITGRQFASRSEILAQNGMAATSQPLATQVALDVLKRGGNAIDAAIAANAMLGLVEPTGCGIGGDLFAMVWDAKNKQLVGLNASGRSPQALRIAELKKRGLSKIPAYGPLPVTVPGAVAGWFALHARFGSLPMKTLLEPAIRYAQKGFPVSQLVAHYWALNAVKLNRFPGFTQTFLPLGRPPAKGEIFRNPALAATYALLAQKGPDVFYKGQIARKIVAYMKKQGGYLSLRDLADHRSEWVRPVSATYRGVRVWQLPPNGQGLAVLQLLNILEDYDIANMGFGSAQWLHLFIEAKKLVYEDRAKYYADSEFNRIPVAQLISKDYARSRAARIDLTKAAKIVPAGDLALEKGDTIYLATADKFGNMVSLIQSNYRGMGSGMTPDGLGFVLQDRGELFSLDPKHANAYAPGKRPFHTIIPAFVTKQGKPYLSFGVMGGSMQPQGQVQVLINLIDFGMNLQEAGDAARIRHGGSSQPTGEKMTDGGTIYLESGLTPAAEALRKRGHTIGTTQGGFGGYQAILWDEKNKVYLGASESRKDGQAAGY